MLLDKVETTNGFLLLFENKVGYDNRFKLESRKYIYTHISSDQIIKKATLGVFNVIGLPNVKPNYSCKVVNINKEGFPELSVEIELGFGVAISYKLHIEVENPINVSPGLRFRK